MMTGRRPRLSPPGVLLGQPAARHARPVDDQLALPVVAQVLELVAALPGLLADHDVAAVVPQAGVGHAAGPEGLGRRAPEAAGGEVHEVAVGRRVAGAVAEGPAPVPGGGPDPGRLLLAELVELVHAEEVVA